MKLHTYYRSSAAWRVRIALHLKGIDADMAPVHLLKDGGEQFGAAYDALNPQHLVPLLEDDGMRLAQSLAIIEYLDETHSVQPLLPADARGRARVRSLSQVIACDTHPVNNLRVLKYLSGTLGITDDQKSAWYRHWVALGLEALERQLARDPETGRFCHGDMPTMADCCLVPQIFNGQRFNTDFSGLPRTMAAFEACMKLEAFQKSQPSACPDAEA